jgi:hypothetical protein
MDIFLPLFFYYNKQSSKVQMYEWQRFLQSNVHIIIYKNIVCVLWNIHPVINPVILIF